MLSGLQLGAECGFDLIILDYELTSFSGGDVVRRLRARGTALPPIILISAHPDLPVIARLHMVSGYLQKPVDADTLHEVLDPLIRQPQVRSAGLTLWRIQEKRR